jgi:hypothetical protein
MNGNGQLHAQAALPPGEEPPVTIGQEAGWAQEPVWTLWRREKSCSAGNRRPVVHPVARRYADSENHMFKYLGLRGMK